MVVAWAHVRAQVGVATTSVIVGPGAEISATPASCNAATSSCEMMFPPDRDQHVVHAAIREQPVQRHDNKDDVAATDRIDSPTTSTSSWSARHGDHLRHLPEPGVEQLEALVPEAARERFAPRSWPSRSRLGDQDLDRAVIHVRRL